jgi:hypothetical protein
VGFAATLALMWLLSRIAKDALTQPLDDPVAPVALEMRRKPGPT